MTPSQIAFYDSIQLTAQEVAEAMLEARVAKYNREKFKDYWLEKEKEVKGKKVDTPVKIK